MGNFYTCIPSNLFAWIQDQKMFWVATAPLSESGHINVSPKGFEGTFHIMDANRVWYEDMTGSGVETISHVRENGRITILFSAFEGPPMLVRLFGTGSIHEFDTPIYNELIPLAKRQPGSRAIIMVEIHKVGTSCGYSVPMYNFRSHRMRLHKVASKVEARDIQQAEAESCISNPTVFPSSVTEQDSDDEADETSGGLKAYWRKANTTSIDGLTGLLTAYDSRTVFDKKNALTEWGQDDESVPRKGKKQRPDDLEARQAVVLTVPRRRFEELLRLSLAFMVGLLVTRLWDRLAGMGGVRGWGWSI